MYTSAASARQRQIRGFVVAWLGITLLMGALTFAGIYYATGLVNNEQSDEASVAALSNAEIEQVTVSGAEAGFDLSQVQTTPAPTANVAAVAAVPASGSQTSSSAGSTAGTQGAASAENTTGSQPPAPGR